MHNSLWVGGSIGRRGFPMLGTGKRGLSTYVKQLFANNEQGFFYDPNNLTTMFQDAAGTIPVTAAGQPVGLMLDKSKGLVLGLETNTNASFNDWSGGKPVGYILFKNDTTTFIEQSINGVRMRSTDGANVQLTRGIAAGKYYEVVINVDSVLSGSVALESQGTRVKLIASSGVHTFRFYALSTGLDLKRGGGVTDFTIRSLSIKELSGNHAYQTVSASRPILRQTPILGAELSFQNLEGNIVPANGGSLGLTLGSQVIAGKTYFISIPAGLKVSMPSGWGSTSNGNPMSVIANASSQFSVLNPTASPITLKGVSVKEITGYRTDQNYLEFDGSDDFLVTNSIDFTSTDKVSLFAGVRKLRDVVTGIVCELSVSVSNVGTFNLKAPHGADTNFGSESGGSIPYSALCVASGYASPIAKVVTATNNISGKRSILFVNSIQAASSTANQGVGNYGNYPLYIGRRAGTYLPFNGHIYGLIGIGKLTSDSETAAVEKELAKRIGVTLSV